MSDLSGRSSAELLRNYRAILAELRTRGAIRTDNAPAGDWAEYLVRAAFEGELAPNSEKSWDVRTPDGRLLQVKCRVVVDRAARGQRQLSPFRSFDFDAAVVVLFNDDFTVWRAVQLSNETARNLSLYRAHVNGHVLIATDAVFSRPDVRDITDLVRRAGTSGG